MLSVLSLGRSKPAVRQGRKAKCLWPPEKAGLRQSKQPGFFLWELNATQWEVMRQLKWSLNQAGTLNGKVGHVTIFTVAYYPERGYFVAPKLPGLNKTIQVSSYEEGKMKAEALYQRFFDFMNGAEWHVDMY
jgi:hypothetical protein